MKKDGPKKQQLLKGTPSAVLLSIAIHAALFLLAGALVVFTVVRKEEKRFEPPKTVERPKMKLKKPKVQLKKTSRPKATARIVTKANRASMPNIELPEMSGMGDGLGGGGISGFDMMPDLGEVTMFGSSTSIGNDFEGTFYDFKRDHSGRRIPTDFSGMEWRSIIRRFFLSGWNTSVLSRYYKSPQKLYATTMVVPLTLSGLAPQAFGDDEAVGALWVVHYKGKLVHQEGIKFRFWGIGDEFIVVRVDGEIVLGAWWPGAIYREQVMPGIWDSRSGESEKYRWGNNWAVIGDWIELAPGEAKDMEILIGDNGGEACFILGVEELGVEYERSDQPSPILPAFKTAQPSHELLDTIYKDLPFGDVCLTNGPVFNDYSVTAEKAGEPEPAELPTTHEAPIEESAPEPSARAWTLADGRRFEAEVVAVIGGKAVFKPSRGKSQKIPLEELSSADREFLELSTPPELDLDFSRSTQQVTFDNAFYGIAWWSRPPETHAHFGVRVKQTSVGDYNHELKSEIFAVGLQRTSPDKQYLLLDRQETVFTLSKENQRTHEFKSEHVSVLTDVLIARTPRGEKYFGHLIVVRDSRGEVIAVKASSNWMAEHRENIEQLAIDNYFDKTGTRVYPARPRPLWK